MARSIAFIRVIIEVSLLRRCYLNVSSLEKVHGEKYMFSLIHYSKQHFNIIRKQSSKPLGNYGIHLSSLPCDGQFNIDFLLCLQRFFHVLKVSMLTAKVLAGSPSTSRHDFNEGKKRCIQIIIFLYHRHNCCQWLH